MTTCILLCFLKMHIFVKKSAIFNLKINDVTTTCLLQASYSCSKYACKDVCKCVCAHVCVGHVSAHYRGQPTNQPLNLKFRLLLCCKLIYMLVMSSLSVCFQSVTEAGKPPCFQTFGKLSIKPAFEHKRELKSMYVLWWNEVNELSKTLFHNVKYCRFTIRLCAIFKVRKCCNSTKGFFFHCIFIIEQPWIYPALNPYVKTTIR